MTESVSSTGSITFQALSDLKAYNSYKKNTNVLNRFNNNDEEQSTDNRRASVTRRALSDLQSRSEVENSSEKRSKELNRSEEKKSVFLSEENIPTDRPSPFLSDDMKGANLKSVFMSEENLPTDRPSPFLSDDMKGANIKSVFMSEDNLPTDRPSPFLSDEVIAQDRTSQFYSAEVDNDASVANAKTQIAKTNYAITSELRNNPMSATMTPFDIAREYGIPLRQAEDIYMNLNADKNGVVREQNLPENSTVSYRV